MSQSAGKAPPERARHAALGALTPATGRAARSVGGVSAPPARVAIFARALGSKSSGSRWLHRWWARDGGHGGHDCRLPDRAAQMVTTDTGYAAPVRAAATDARVACLLRGACGCGV
eukprot:scaffold148_cov78-Phaeocystis_antarctica.AAC.16